MKNIEKGANFFEQFWSGKCGDLGLIDCRLLLKRNTLENFRNVSVVWTKIATSIVIAVIMGSTFFQLKTAQSDIQDRINALFFVMVHLVLTGYTALPRRKSNYY